MDYTRLDAVRRKTRSPLQLDVVEAFADGRLSPARVHRCGARSSACRWPRSPRSSPPAAARPTPRRPPSGGARRRRPPAPHRRHRRHHPGRCPAAGVGGPHRMQDLGGYGITAQSFEFLATQQTIGDPGGLAPGLADGVEPNADGSVWTFKLRQGVKWHDGNAVHRCRRRRHDGTPGRGRQCGSEGHPPGGRCGRRPIRRP